jgi:hypothetical protein
MPSLFSDSAVQSVNSTTEVEELQCRDDVVVHVALGSSPPHG